MFLWYSKSILILLDLRLPQRTFRFSIPCILLLFGAFLVDSYASESSGPEA